MRRRRQSRVVDNILHAVRHTVKCSAPVSAHDFRFGIARILHRELGRKAKERV